MKTLGELTKKYRSHKSHIKKLAQQREKLMNQVQSLSDRMREGEKSIHSLKTLIDFCVETGQSPVEAQLKNTPSEIADHVYQTGIEGWSGLTKGYITTGANITSGSVLTVSSSTYPNLTINSASVGSASVGSASIGSSSLGSLTPLLNTTP
jgi:hypothetical protein